MFNKWSVQNKKVVKEKYSKKSIQNEVFKMKCSKWSVQNEVFKIKSVHNEKSLKLKISKLKMFKIKSVQN